MFNVLCILDIFSVFFFFGPPCITPYDDCLLQIEDDEFEHFEDDEEFEGFDREKSPKGKTQERPPDLKITPVTFTLC